ncbi:GTP cyclohydrolase I [Haliangium ochraceum DSM 14365]|uniref:GTP cyclohydrolase I n=1 Tax=Haliangium ochraceum (strain DSM 14365 / JCM 11303 / SMP-2) TaxID=502025 RepID=D0LRN8_HALO1|nr:GTP cyclohydrolase I [Haliangium ochraceum DSM 14365]
MEKNQRALDLFTKGFESILEGIGELGYDITDANFADTAPRAAKGLHELIHDQAKAQDEVKKLLSKTFPARYTEMVISKHNVAFGVCPHHILPVIYRISLAYIPVKKVLGLSKLSRLARLYARSPMLQEDLTHELCRTLHEDLESEGAAVYIEGLHMCMAARGIGAHEARLVTSAVRGVFLNEPATRNEFIKLVTTAHPPLV